MEPILVATDLSARSDRAVTRAARLARAMGRPLHLFAAVGDDLDAAEALERSEDVLALLEHVGANGEGMRGLDVTASAEVGRAVTLVPEAAQARNAALVVLGSHRNRGLGEVVGTPTLVRIVRALEQPALVAVGRPNAEYGSVVVGWDFSHASEAALRMAGAVAPEAELTVLNATHEPYSGLGTVGAVGHTLSPARREEMAAEIAAAIPEDLRGRTAAPEVRMGAPVQALLDARADLVAVGRHQRSGLVRMLLGETSSELILISPSDVLVTPPPTRTS